MGTISRIGCFIFRFYIRTTFNGNAKKSGFGIKDCLTEASLGWICFGTYNKVRQFYNFNDKYVRDFVRKSIHGGRCVSFNRFCESNQCEEILKIITKLKKKDNEFSNIFDNSLKNINNKRDEYKLEFENGEKDYQKKRRN